MKTGHASIDMRLIPCDKHKLRCQFINYQTSCAMNKSEKNNNNQTYSVRGFHLQSPLLLLQIS